MKVIALNFIYSIFGGLITMGFMAFGYKILDKLTPFNTAEQLEAGNRAVGQMVAGMFIAIGIAIGLVIGMGLN